MLGKGSSAPKALLSCARDAKKGLTASTCTHTITPHWLSLPVHKQSIQLPMQIVSRLKQQRNNCTCLEIAGLALTAADERACGPDLGKVPVMAQEWFRFNTSGNACHLLRSSQSDLRDTHR